MPVPFRTLCAFMLWGCVLPALAQTERVPNAPTTIAPDTPIQEAPIVAELPLSDAPPTAPATTLADPSPPIQEAPIVAELPLPDASAVTPSPTPEDSATTTDASAALPDATIGQIPPPMAAFTDDESAQREALQTYVDGVLSSLQREHGLAALTVSVVSNDSLWMAQGYGLADVSAARPVVADSTLFRIGSVSKTFIWTAVMMLVERGQIDLDADVNQYLKSVRVTEAFGTPVTMRHLMHHRAGFEDNMRLFAVADDDPRTLAELLTEQQPARVYAPGLRTSYSNWGSALAAQVVADASGKPYGEFLRSEILDRLGMRATTFTVPSKREAGTDLATGYKGGMGALALQGYMQLGAYWPAGGIASTATDMARWMRFHLNGGELEGVRLMTAETHARMWTRGFDDRPGAADLAHGFQDRSYRGLRLLGHGGATAAFFTNMVLVPELGLGIFVSQNSSQTRLPVTQLPDLIIDHVHGDRYLPAQAVDTTDGGTLSEVAGTYLQNRRVFSSFATVLGLDATAEVATLSPDVLRVTLNDQPRQYRRVGSERDLFEAADGGRIAFVREGGRVVALADSSGVHTLEKVGVLGNPGSALVATVSAIVLALTSLLGFWWRLGRGPAYGQGFAAGLAASTILLASLCAIGFAVVAGWLVKDLSAFDLSTMAATYPPQSMLYTHYAGWVVAGAAAAMWLALIPAWVANGWGLWRRLHYSVFALVLSFAAYQLWRWRVFDAPIY